MDDNSPLTRRRKCERLRAQKTATKGRAVYSTYTGKVLGVRDGDNVYLTKVHSPTARRSHAFAAAPTPRAERAIVTYQGVAFAVVTGAGQRYLPASWRAARISHVQRPERAPAAPRLWVWQSTTNSLGEVHRHKVYASAFVSRERITGTVEHYTKEHL